MGKKLRFASEIAINAILFALVVLGVILLYVTAKQPDVLSYLNEYEKRIIDASLLFFILGIILAVLILGILILCIIHKASNIKRILSIFTAGLLAIPLAGIFVSLCKNNGAQIAVLVLLLITYLGNIAYQIYLLITDSKKIEKKEDYYFKELTQ